MRLSFSWSAVALNLVYLLGAQGCENLPLLAPTESTIIVVASDSVIPVDGESIITAVVTEAVGTPVQNGTLVTFSTTLGSISPQESKTQNGRAMTRLLARKTPGTATVTAFSGRSISNTVSVHIGQMPAVSP